MSAPSLLFHGSAFDFDAPIANDTDGVFWTTTNSRLAQHYIRQPHSITTPYIFSDQLDRPVRPEKNCPLYTVVQMMGFLAEDVHYDRCGAAVSFTTSRDYPTYRRVANYIEQQLGYTPRTSGPLSYQLYTDGWDSDRRHDRIAHALVRAKGYLYLIAGIEDKKFCDLRFRRHQSSHLSNTRFCERAMPGYDGVLLNDFFDSTVMGKIEHKAYGLFPQALEGLAIERVDASHYEWPFDDHIAGETEEFLRWRASSKAEQFLSPKTKPGELSLAELRSRASNLARVA
jgi:hypothetical protein